MNTKCCAKCRLEYPLNEFPRYRDARDGRYYHRPYCRLCRNHKQKEYIQHHPEQVEPKYLRQRYLKHVYKMTVEDYNKFLITQGGACAICRTTDPGRYANFCVDHDHTTGMIRGLLCQKCNQAIGLLQDSPKNCKQAAKYLQGK